MRVTLQFAVLGSRQHLAMFLKSPFPAEPESKATRTKGSVAAAEAALFDALPADAHATYWDALARFIRFEITKPEFTQACSCLVGPCVELHNAFIRALLTSALDDTSELDTPQQLMGPRVSLKSVANQGFVKSEPVETKTDPMELPPSSEEPAAPPKAALPKLALRIRRDASGFSVVGGDEPSTEEVSVPDEDAASQINALHDKCSELARLHGVTNVTPEAISFLHKALKINMYRLITAGANSRQGSRSAPRVLGKRNHTESGQLTRERLAGAMHQPHHLGTWTLPPCQRFNLAAAACARQNFL